MSLSTPNTRKWTHDDIQTIQDACPEGVSFRSLTTPKKTTFQLDGGQSVNIDEMPRLRDAITEAMEDIGISVEKITVNAGYSGSNSPHVLFTIFIED